jgi:hypothetical protein
MGTTLPVWIAFTRQVKTFGPRLRTQLPVFALSPFSVAKSNCGIQVEFEKPRVPPVNCFAIE